jgi:MFS family permease
LWGAETISQLGTQLTALAIPLIAALSLDASPAQMGLLVATGTAPALLVGLFVGVWVDRLPRKPVLIVADLARGALLGLIPVLWVLDTLSITMLYAIGFGVGIFTVFFDVAYQAYLPALVGRDDLLEGNGKLQASASFAQVAGPGLGGGLIALITAPAAIAVDAVSFVLSAVLIGKIKTQEPPVDRTVDHPKMIPAIAEGLRAVVADPLLRALAGCSATTTLFGWGFLAVYVLYMTEDLGLSAAQVGFVFATGGMGALIGAVLAGPAARRFGVGKTIVGSRVLVGIFGLTVPAAVLVPSVALPLVVFAEFAQWLVLLIADVNTVTIRQAITPDRLQGRVNATWKFIVSGLVPIGGLMGGLIGEWYGVQTTLVIGILGMLAAAAWVWASPVRSMTVIPSEPADMPDPAVAV